MTDIFNYLISGGPLMWVITVLGLGQGLCIAFLLLSLRRAHWQRAADLLAPLRAVVAVVPLLGLLGTVGGMVLCFSGVSGQQFDSAALGAGVAQALYTTHYALAIAIPGLIAERLLSAYFNRRMAETAAGDELAPVEADAQAWHGALS